MLCQHTLLMCNECTLRAAFSPCWAWIHHLWFTLLIPAASPRGVQCCSTTSLTTPLGKGLVTGGVYLAPEGQRVSQMMSNQLLMYTSHGKVIWLYQWSNFVIAAVQRTWEATQGTGKWPRSEASLDCYCHIPFVTTSLSWHRPASAGHGCKLDRRHWRETWGSFWQRLVLGLTASFCYHHFCFDPPRNGLLKKINIP